MSSSGRAVISYDHLHRRVGAPRHHRRPYTVVESGRRKFHPKKVHPLFEGLRIRRIELGISQKKLGERIGVNLTTLCRWECGSIVPSALKLLDWCAALQVELRLEPVGP